MKALHFIRIFNSKTATFVYNEMTELVQMGITVKVCCLERINEELFPFEDTEVLPQSFWQRKFNNGLRRLGWRYRFRDARTTEYLSGLLKAYEPAVIHCHFGLHALFFLDNLERGDIPVFISFHGYDASKLLSVTAYRDRLQEVFSLPHVFPIFVSDFMRENVEKSGVDIPNSFILYYGTDLRFFTRSVTPPAKPPFVFLQVSSFREKKGHRYTLEAFALLLKQYPAVDARLILAGDGPLRPAMEALARDLGIGEKVIFPGYVTPGQARDLMSQAHAFVHHSVVAKSGDMEGIPNAIMEAMAMELPVLSTYHSGIPELVEDGRNGYLVAEKDVALYAERMHDMLDWNLKPENREKVAQSFEKKQHARTLIGYYREGREFLEKRK